METSIRQLSAPSRRLEAIPLLPSAGQNSIIKVNTGRFPGRNLRTAAKISTGTGPTDIIHHIASKTDGLRGPTSAPLPKNMPCGPFASRAPSTSGVHRTAASARERFTRARPISGRITRAAPAVHVDVRHVLGLEDAPAHCPATEGAQGRSWRVRACKRCVRSGWQHTCSRCMPTWISAPHAGRGSSDPLQPFWSCPRLTCGDGDPTEEEMGS